LRDEYFFFSSRRRHTRFSRDWSSDVCSSDLALQADMGTEPVTHGAQCGHGSVHLAAADFQLGHAHQILRGVGIQPLGSQGGLDKIGRASCRERGEMTVAGVGVEEKELSYG